MLWNEAIAKGENDSQHNVELFPGIVATNRTSAFSRPRNCYQFVRSRYLTTSEGVFIIVRTI